MKVVEGVDGAANIAIAPDGAIWYAEVYTGDLFRVDPATGAKQLQHHVDSVASQDERGLIGFALHPDVAQNGAYYLYYTAPDPGNESGGTNKLVLVQDGNERVLAQMTAFEEHNSGRIVVAPDRTMFVSTGENQLRDPAQDPKSLLGKILRMTLDGKPVQGNLDGLVYSKGHRNPYGLAYNAETNELWETENSGWRRDEINRIQAGGNYGYPECEGLGLNGVSTPCPTDKGYIMPVMSFYEDRTAAPTGAAFWRGDLHWLALKEGTIHRLSQDGSGWKDQVVHDTDELVLDLRVSPAGDLFLSTWDTIYRLDFPSLGPEQPRAGDASGAAVRSVGGAAVLGIIALALLLTRRA